MVTIEQKCPKCKQPVGDWEWALQECWSCKTDFMEYLWTVTMPKIMAKAIQKAMKARDDLVWEALEKKWKEEDESKET